MWIISILDDSAAHAFLCSLSVRRVCVPYGVFFPQKGIHAIFEFDQCGDSQNIVSDDVITIQMLVK